MGSRIGKLVEVLQGSFQFFGSFSYPLLQGLMGLAQDGLRPLAFSDVAGNPLVAGILAEQMNRQQQLQFQLVALVIEIGHVILQFKETEFPRMATGETGEPPPEQVERLAHIAVRIEILQQIIPQQGLGLLEHAVHQGLFTVEIAVDGADANIRPFGDLRHRRACEALLGD